MRACIFLVFVGLAVAQAQPAAVLDDLEQRALAAMDGIRRVESWSEMPKWRAATRARIEQSLKLDRTLSVESCAAFLYAPKEAANPAPAVILVRPHDDPAAVESRLLPAAMAQMGIFVVELDARAHHSRFDLLVDGILPQSLVQRDLRAALGYLKGRADVDPKRLAVVGEGLSAIVAAAINPEFSGAVLLEGAPDFKSVIRRFRSLTPDQQPDSCELLPGTLQHAVTEDFLSLISPRPLLLINPADRPLQYAIDVYRSDGQGERISHLFESGWTVAARYAAYSWLARSLEGRSELGRFQEANVFTDPLRLKLAAPTAEAPGSRLPVSEESLTSFLGAPLPEGSISFALHCHREKEITYYPQPGIRVPVSVFRPGSDGCGAERGTMIAVDDQGRQSLAKDEIVNEAVRRGWMVWMLDPRCIGELKTNSEPFVFAVSLLLGESVTWRQSADILRLLRRVAGSNRPYPTALYARGKNMSIAASYVAAIATQRELQWIILRDAALTFRDLSDVRPFVVPFGVGKSFDLPDTWKAAKGNLLVITRPEDFLERDW